MAVRLINIAKAIDAVDNNVVVMSDSGQSSLLLPIRITVLHNITVGKTNIRS